jgi:hypothetical protein
VKIDYVNEKMTETPIKSGELELGKVKHDEIDVIALQYAEYLHVDSNQQVQLPQPPGPCCSCSETTSL